MIMNGFSTGWPPIHVSIRRSAIRHQSRIWFKGRNIVERCFDVCRVGIMNNTRMESRRASTPPSLFGMDRRIA